MKKGIISALLLLLMINITGCNFSKTYEGKLEYESRAYDPTFDIEVDSPVLLRVVKMVQYSKSENGEVELVLSNYPIESFDGYTNPPFPDEIESSMFHSELMFSGMNVDEKTIKKIVNNDENRLVKLTGLDEKKANKYGLILYDDSYVSSSNDWEVGEIMVSFYYLEPDTIYSINGINEDGVFSTTSSSKINYK